MKVDYRIIKVIFFYYTLGLICKSSQIDFPFLVLDLAPLLIIHKNKIAITKKQLYNLQNLHNNTKF